MTLTVRARPRRSAAEILEETRRVFEPAYRSAVTALPVDIARIGGYHIGWWDAQGTPTQQGGKSIRPALVLASAAANTHGSAELTHERAIIAASHPHPGNDTELDALIVGGAGGRGDSIDQYELRRWRAMSQCTQPFTTSAAYWNAGE